MITRFSIALLLTLFVAGCQHGPPKESGQFREAELVEIARLDPTIGLDIPYATTNNFLRRPVYAQARAFLQRPAAEALSRVQQALKPKGCGLVIFDGYRPWSVTKLFWDSASVHERKIEFVANPRKGSRHNRGCAVDLTLCDLATGRQVEMPSGYDEFTERAFPNYAGGAPRKRGPGAIYSARRWRRRDSPSIGRSGGTSITRTGSNAAFSICPSSPSDGDWADDATARVHASGLFTAMPAGMVRA